MRERIYFYVNNSLASVTVEPSRPLLSVLREEIGLKGPKLGCGEGDCGACAVLLGEMRSGRVSWRHVPSCLVPAVELPGRHVVTVEALAGDGAPKQVVAKYLVEEGAVQCGYCTPGMVVAATSFLLNGSGREDAEIFLDGHICRCTGYVAIKRALRRLSEAFAGAFSLPAGSRTRMEWLADRGVLPRWMVHPRLGTRFGSGAEALEDSVGNGIPVAGGTDLMVKKPKGLAWSRLVPLMNRPKLRTIELKCASVLRLGAAVTLEELRRSLLVRSIFPQFAEAMKRVGSTLVRNRATVGGNLVNASPVGDVSVMLLALGARVVIRRVCGGEETRVVSLSSFFKGPGLADIDIGEGEVLEAVELDLPTRPHFFGFEKVSRRKGLDIAAASCALSLEFGEGGKVASARVAAGGVAPTPLLLEAAARRMEGTRFEGQQWWQKAAASAMEEVQPISDLRGSKWYRKALVGRMVEALSRKAEEEARKIRG